MSVYTALLLPLLLNCNQHPLDLALTPESGAMNVLHWFHSPDRKVWTYNGPVAWGVTSLGAHEDGDNLAITCIQEVRPPTWLEQQLPRVYGYLFDGTNFTQQTGASMILRQRVISILSGIMERCGTSHLPDTLEILLTLPTLLSELKVQQYTQPLAYLIPHRYSTMAQPMSLPHKMGLLSTLLENHWIEFWILKR